MASHAPQAAQHGNPFAILGVAGIVLFPIIYGILGFIGGVIAAAIYNLVAKMTGGIEFTSVDVPPTLAPSIGYPTN